jgi:LPS-assembly protein
MLPASRYIKFKSGHPELASAILLLLIACLVSGGWSAAQSRPLMPSTDISARTPWRISADRLTYNHQTRVYTAEGAVKIRKDDLTLTADHVRLDQETANARAEGSVLLITNSDRLSGDSMDINLEAETGVVTRGELFIEQNHFFIRGDDIRKTGENSFSVSNGSLTSCAGENPDWRITGKEVDVTVEGYGTARHATLWARRVPVFYTPYIIFPVKLERQSGLLFPQAGYSERRGITYIQPLFWAISRSSDATFYYHHLQKRGEKLGGEFRYVLSDDSRGVLMADGFNDRKIDDGTPEASRRWGYPDDRYIRPNTDRYWFRMKADQELPWQLTAKLDLDVVSDQDYLREFSDGYTGYQTVNDDFKGYFGRDLDDKNDIERENRLNINRIWSTYSFNADAAWYDNVVNRRLSDTDPTLHHLPRAGLSGLKHRLPFSPLFIDMTSEYTYFYRRDGSTGHRADLYPRIYLPLNLRHYLAFEPSTGFRQTAWYTDRHDAGGPDTENYQHRELYDFRVDLSSDLYRIFNVNAGSLEKIKHTVAPKIQYLYLPEQNQDDLPFRDELDRIEETHRVTFSLINLVTPAGFADDPSLEPANRHGGTWRSYGPLGRLLIEQPYDLTKRSAADENPFEPLYMRLELDPASQFTFLAEAAWDHDEGNLFGHNSRIVYSGRQENRLACEYRYRRDRAQSLFIDTAFAVLPSVLLFGEYERNLETNQDIYKSIGCQYRAQCWTFFISFSREDDDNRVGFMIALSGLGDFGSR